MTVLVTGGGGLIGSRIVHKLLARGETVVSLDASADQAHLDQHEADPQLQRVCYASSISTYGDQDRYGDVAVNEDSDCH